MTSSGRVAEAATWNATMASTINRNLVYTLKEVARLLRVEPVTVRRLILRGKLTKLPFIRHIRVPAESVERFVNGGTTL